MATKNMSLQVNDSFTLDEFAEKMKNLYHGKGYDVIVTSSNGNSMSLVIQKDNDGVKNYIGLGTQEELNLSVVQSSSDKTLNISFNDGCMTMRVIDIAVGWFVCFVPFFTGIMGFVNQSNFQKSLQDDIRNTAN